MSYTKHIKRWTISNRQIGIVSLLGIFSVILSGCNDEEMIDLKQYVQQVKSRPRGIIESLPEIRPHETFTYQAAELRNPFVSAVVDLPPEAIVQASPKLKNTLKPNLKRHKEALEEYAIDSLRMVGMLEQGMEIWAIIRASDGILYRIKRGNHIGQNYGKVTHINEEKIEFTEIVPDEQGGWLTRQNILALAE
ncbi:Pilus assembly protein PilP [Nitrosococcus watsonii C-113]|uniref:Pilus assembly protein PilP n=2 Tax=Nitrosococcus TaxID=1227 RepID=D8K9M9_NITWC|nr:Pilus assembly protein PilP [Nitrosococcus watsonii C-113]